MFNVYFAFVIDTWMHSMGDCWCFFFFSSSFHTGHKISQHHRLFCMIIIVIDLTSFSSDRIYFTLECLMLSVKWFYCQFLLHLCVIKYRCDGISLIWCFWIVNCGCTMCNSSISFISTICISPWILLFFLSLLS